MRCPKCMAENAATRRFCAQCGAPLPSPCPACGFENEPTARFCGGCGKPVGEAAAPAPPAPSPPARTDAAERRQLTVMFCDLVGSTPLSARFDPEDLRGIMGSYHRCVAETVEGFGGFVAGYMGDGVLSYFGYPQAHEDDAERAIRCGLAVVEQVPRLNLAETLHTRIGIPTGLVVVGGEANNQQRRKQSPWSVPHRVPPCFLAGSSEITTESVIRLDTGCKSITGFRPRFASARQQGSRLAIQSQALKSNGARRRYLRSG